MGQVGEVGATETSADGYLRALADCVDEGVAICHNGLICWASSRMAELTGGDVAASDDLTGSTAKNGDWELELVVGQVNDRAISSWDYSELLTPGHAIIF